MSEFLYKPNYTITDEILNLVALIAARVDVLTIQSGMEPNPKLRRANRIRTIHSSLAIENNSLSLEQVTAIMDGKRVIAPPQDICEVENAFQVYNRLLEFDPYDAMDLLTAHQILMKDLVKKPGQYRSGNVGVVRGKDSLDLKHRPTFRKNYLHPALEAGLIEMTLPKTPNARNQKYRRRSKGDKV